MKRFNRRRGKRGWGRERTEQRSDVLVRDQALCGLIPALAAWVREGGGGEGGLDFGVVGVDAGGVGG